MGSVLPGYKEAVVALAAIMTDLPPVIITIDGRDGTGKTSLGRYLAWHFNVSLVETDLFLIQNQGGLVYRYEEINRIIGIRLDKPRPVILEGVGMKDLLKRLGRSADFAIYVTNPEQSSGPTMDQLLSQYEATHSPAMTADVVLELVH